MAKKENDITGGFWVLPENISKDQKELIEAFANAPSKARTDFLNAMLTQKYGWSIPARISKLLEEINELGEEGLALGNHVVALKDADDRCETSPAYSTEYDEAVDDFDKIMFRMMRELADVNAIVNHINSILKLYYGASIIKQMQTYAFAKQVIRETIPDWGHSK